MQHGKIVTLMAGEGFCCAAMQPNSSQVTLVLLLHERKRAREQGTL